MAEHEYYYRMDGCKAVGPAAPDCICWHRVGTGPFPDARPGEQVIPGTWRATADAPADPKREGE